MAPTRIETSLGQASQNRTCASEITISEYIFHRLAQSGVGSLFGVPGDFNLSMLEHIYDVPELNWIGCCNELNASYAADAYAKTSSQMAAILTTYGVGELSALNGIAGAYTEFAPVVHVVGTTALADKRSAQTKNFHHLVPNHNVYQKPNHYLYEEVASKFSVATASLEDDPEVACDMVDNVLETVWRESRPGYIFLPCDLAEMEVPVSRLDRPLQFEYAQGNKNSVNNVVDEIVRLLEQSSNTSILADTFIQKFRMTKQFSALISMLKDKVNLFDTFMGKGLVDESLERFVGTYSGKSGDCRISSAIEQSDVVLHVGNYSAEMNTGFFSFKLEENCQLIELNPQYIRIGDTMYTDVTLMDVLPALLQEINVFKIQESPFFSIPKQSMGNLKPKAEAPLTEADVGKSLEAFVRPDDVVIIETCSFLTGAYCLKMNGARMLSQCCWGAIGYALPATLGAALALRDLHLPGKVVTIEGDGSAQMSLQELATMLRYNVSAVMFLLNNSGYTIERAIKGPHSSYNDICENLQWTQMLRTFGDVDEKRSRSTRVNSAKQLARLVSTNELRFDSRLQMMELALSKFDIPWKY